MRKKLVLHRETLRVLSGSLDLRAAVGGTNTDTCMDSITGGCYSVIGCGESQAATFCYPTRVNDCGYTHDAHCAGSDFSFCVCAE